MCFNRRSARFQGFRQARDGSNPASAVPERAPRATSRLADEATVDPATDGRTVPRERVRLDTETVTEERQVGGAAAFLAPWSPSAGDQGTPGPHHTQ